MTARVTNPLPGCHGSAQTHSATRPNSAWTRNSHSCYDCAWPKSTNCTYCLIRHYEAARNLGTSQAKLDTLTAWWETHLFSAAEQAALAYTEVLTRASDTTADSRFQSYHDLPADHFDEAQILDIIGIVINMNVWTRMKLAEGAMPR